ncbi:hypothetical protein E2320_012168 [Naja naja]|nr:hypothetical protein E2320_012168 [Naja naja]
MAFVSTQGPTVVDQTTLMKKYLQFVAALTDANTPDETKLKMMQEVSENFEQLRKLVLEIIHRIPTNEHLRPHTKNILSVMFRFLETENEENVLICLRIIIELHKQFRPPITQEIHHFLDFVKQIYKELPKVVNRYFENPQVVPENTIPTPEMVGLITTIVVKLYKLNIHNVVAEFVPLIMNTIIIQVSNQASSQNDTFYLHQFGPDRLNVIVQEIWLQIIHAQLQGAQALADQRLGSIQGGHQGIHQHWQVGKEGAESYRDGQAKLNE